MTTNSRNTLGGAYEAAYTAARLVADITLFLDIASKRPQPGVSDAQRQEVEKMFAQLRGLVDEADTAAREALDAQPAVQPAVRTLQRAGHAFEARRRGRR